MCWFVKPQESLEVFLKEVGVYIGMQPRIGYPQQFYIAMPKLFI